MHATLHREAVRAKAAGDPRSIGQLMADILVQRVVSPGLADTATAPRGITWASRLPGHGPHRHATSR